MSSNIIYSNTTMNSVHSALRNDNWDLALRLIQQGYPRPNEDEIGNYYIRSVSKVKYFKSIGVRMKYLNEYTAKAFPELLDRLKEPKVQSKFDPYHNIDFDISRELLRYAVDTRPDLYDTVRKLVLTHSIVDLFFEFDIKFEEIEDLGQTFERKSADRVYELKEKWNVPDEAIYPALVQCSGWSEWMISEELVQYCLENWSSVDIGNRHALRYMVPREYSIKTLNYIFEDEYHNHGRMVDLTKSYSDIFPELQEVINRFRNDENDFLQNLFRCISKLLKEYDVRS